jgi:2-succinyl-5-enolpyruvyl-6-hydroxy-3-cyclohexene-1-carboxylate synthase
MMNQAFSRNLAAKLADLGVAHACISPGSRNTPLIAGFAAEDRIEKWPILDERSAGFFGVGLAKATGQPVVLICTSGTAAVEYHAAVVEASQSEVPLIVLTADRPPALRNVGAPQTIDQLSLYGSSPRLFIDAGVPDQENVLHATDLATEAWRAATSSPPGPVHLNLPFAEPLLDGTSPQPPESGSGPPLPTDTPPAVGQLARTIAGRKGLIVAGRNNDPAFPTACARLAATTGFPVIADPLTGLRHGVHPLEHVLACGDLLAAAGLLDRVKPDLVLRLGPLPTSKAVWTWLAANPDVEQILVAVDGKDATASASTVLTDTPTRIALALAESIAIPTPSAWAAEWRRADEAAAATTAATLATAGFPNEPEIARIVVDAMQPQTSFTVGSSMPIRDVDAYAGKSAQPIRVFGNRGANGIDGVVSAALGTAASGLPAVVLVGDVSLFHDLNALGTAAQLDLALTIVVINNDGGGIFHFLPQSDPEIMDAATFESLLATPHGTDFVAIAGAMGIEAHEVTDPNELGRLVSAPNSGPRLIQVRTDRVANRELHRRLLAEVGRALTP